MLEPANHVEVVAEQPDVELVFAVERKHVRHGDAADGAERQPLELRRLRLVAFDRVRLRADARSFGSPTASALTRSAAER